MWNAIKRLYSRKNGFIYACFDVSTFLYMISYFYHYQESDSDARIRMISSILLLGFGLLIWIPKIKKISISTVWYFLFVGWSAASVLWAADSKLASSVIPTLIRVLLFSHFVSMRIKTDDEIELFLSLYTLATIYMTVNIMIKMINYYSISNILVTRFGDNFGYNSNLTAMLGCFTIMICAHRIRKKKYIFINILVILYMLAIMVMTSSKKGFLGLIIGLVLIAQFKNTGSKKINRIFFTMIAVIAIYALVMTVPFLYDQVGHRLEQMIETLGGASGISYSTDSRIGLLSEAASTWLDHFFIGVGLNNFELFQDIQSGYYAHSNYLELLADLGTIGFLIFYIFPFFVAFSKIDKKNDLHVTIKTICILELIYEIASVSYQDFRVLIFLWFIPLIRLRPINVTFGSDR